MAKTVKKKKKVGETRSGIEKVDVNNAKLILNLQVQIIKLNERINSIIKAHESCKNLKGL